MRVCPSVLYKSDLRALAAVITADLIWHPAQKFAQGANCGQDRSGYEFKSASRSRDERRNLDHAGAPLPLFSLPADKDLPARLENRKQGQRPQHNPWPGVGRETKPGSRPL